MFEQKWLILTSSLFHTIAQYMTKDHNYKNNYNVDEFDRLKERVSHKDDI